MFRPLDDCFRCDPALGGFSGTSVFRTFGDMGNLIQKIEPMETTTHGLSTQTIAIRKTSGALTLKSAGIQEV